MGFLAKVLNRPAHERPFLVIPLGYAAEGARVPALTRKPLDEITVRV
jgi:nitroreductase